MTSGYLAWQGNTKLVSLDLVNSDRFAGVSVWGNFEITGGQVQAQLRRTQDEKYVNKQLTYAPPSTLGGSS